MTKSPVFQMGEGSATDALPINVPVPYKDETKGKDNEAKAKENAPVPHKHK